MTNYEKAKASRNRDKDKEKESSLSNYDKALKSRSYNKIGMDTFEEDLRTTGSLVSDVYSKWQSPEALSSAYDQISNTQKRLSAYQDYNSKYNAGYNDMSDVLKGYDDILSGWNDLTALHGQYKTADAFNSAMKKSVYDRKYAGSSYKDIQDSMKKLSKDSDEYDYLSRYSNYDNLNDLDLAIMGYKDNDHLTELNTKRNKMMLDNKFEKYKSVMDQEGFNGAYDSSITDEFYNVVNNGLSNEAQGRRMMSGAGALSKAERQYAQYSLDQMTDDEKAVFNHLYAQNPKEAMAYLKDMKDNFNRRGTQEMSDIINNADMGTAEQLAVASPFAFAKGGKDLANKAVRDYVNSALSIPANVVGGIGALAGAVTGDFNNPYSNASRLSNMAGDIRQQTSQDIADMGDGFVYDNVLPFLYQTGMSVGDSALGAYVFGEKYTPIMGVNAYQQKYRELKEAGESEGKAKATAFASGVAEAFFEKFSIDSLLKEKGIDGARKWLLEALKQGGVEASEEIATEFANQLADLAIRQDTSDIIRQHKELMDRGYTKEEADHATQIDKIKDIIEAGLGGFLSGGLMQGGKGIVDYDYNKSTGASLRESGNDQRVLDALARLSDEESETYKAYTDYANRGINQNTITDAQLGNLYNTSMRDDIDTFNDDKADDQSRAKALYRMDKLSQIASIDNSVQQNKEATPVQNVELSTKETAKEYVKQYGAMAKGTENIDYELVSKFMTHEEVLDAYAEGVRERDQKFEAKKMALAEQASKNHSVKGVFNSDILDMSSSTTDGSKINWDSLTPNQQKGVKFLEMFSKATGVNITLIASKATESGKREGELGSFTKGNNTIEIDIYSGMHTISDKMNAGMVNTLSHELTHWLEEKSGKAYTALRENVLNYLKQTGVSLESRIADEIQRNLDLGRKNFTEEDAIREIVARSCEDMLTNSEYAKDMLSRLSEEDRNTLVGKMKGMINDIRKWINKFLSEFKATTEEARLLRDFDGFLESTSKLWDQALKEAVEFNKLLNDAGVEYDGNTESAYSIDTWRESEYVTNFNQSAKELSEALGVSLAKAKKYINDINGIAKIIANDEVLQYTASPESSFVSNAEYGGSIDFSTLCKKRRLFTGTMQEIQRQMRNTAFTVDDYLKIRNMMLRDELEATCGCCYVEGSRAGMGVIMQKFVEKYNKTNPPYKVDMYDVNTPDGLAELQREHPEAYKAYDYFMNNMGRLTPDDSTVFATQRKPRQYTLRTSYKGEILQKFKNGEKIDSKNKFGGLRFQSFSDFEIVNLIDCMQVIMDMSKVGLAGQAYTKVYDFADALGQTGLKINLSLIAKGVDADGNLIFDDIEGMAHDMAFELRGKYSQNVGTICVVFTDEQIKSALKHPEVDYIIPFHRSQWGKKHYDKLGLPKGTKDYTMYQNERMKGANGRLKAVHNKEFKQSNYMPNSYWDFSKSGRENAQKYIDMCNENGRDPKFSFLLDGSFGNYSLPNNEIGDNYFKLLIDFKMYDNSGKGAEQKPVKPIFDTQICEDMLKRYALSGESANKFPVAQDIVDEFISDYKKEHPRKQYADRDSDYMELAENPEANRSQLERMTEEEARRNGYDSPLLFTGSRDFGHTVFRVGKHGIFLTTSSDVAGSYSGYGKNASVNRTKDISKATKADDFKSMSTDELLEYYNKNRIGNDLGDHGEAKRLDDYEFVRGLVGNSSNRLKKSLKGIELIRNIDSELVKRLYSENKSYFKNKYDIDDLLDNFNEIKINMSYIEDSIRDLSNSESLSENKLFSLLGDYNVISDIVDNFNDSILYDFLAYTYDELPNNVSWDNISQISDIKMNIDSISKVFSKWYSDEEMFHIGKQIINKESLINYAKGVEQPKDYGGVYSLYAKLGKSYVVDAGGNLFNKIPASLVTDIGISDNNIVVSTDIICDQARKLGYDSVIIKNVIDVGERGFGDATENELPKSDDYIVFDASRIKSADPVTYDDAGNVIPLSERFNSNSDDIRFADRDKPLTNMTSIEKELMFSYENLISKPDIKIVKLGKYNSSLSNNDVSKLAKKNAIDNGFAQNDNGAVKVYVPDIKSYVTLTTKGLRHNLRRDQTIISPATLSIGEILYNSIALNELNPKYDDDADSSYVLYGIAEDDNGNKVVVRTLINVYTMELQSTDGIYYSENLKAIDAKKESAVLNAPRVISSSTDSKMSVSSLLDYVNEYIPDTLSESVLKHFGRTERPIKNKTEAGNFALYADRIKTDVDSTLGIQRDNEIHALLDEIEILKERVKLERKITGGNKLNPNQIYKVATSINTLANSKYNAKKLATELEEIYNYINNSVDVDATSVFSKFFELARNVVGEERETIIEDSYMKEIAKDIKLHRINLTPDMEKWLVSQYGSNFRQALRSLMLFATDGSGVSLDQRWQSLSAQHPETFDENITGEDQLENLIEIAQATKEASYQIQKFNTDETIKDVAYAMYDGYWNVNPIKTTADVYQKQIKELKTKHKESQQKLKDRLDRQKLADDMHYGKIIERLRNQRDKARENAKAKYDRMEETREKNKLIGSITKNSLDLNKKFTDNSVKSHIPESMKGAVVGLINAIDYSSKSMLNGKSPTNKDVKLSTAMEKVRRLFAQMNDDQKNEIFTIDLPVGYEKNVQDLVDSLSKLEERGTPYVLNDMSVDQLKELDKIVKIIKTAVNNINKWNSSIKGNFISDCENGIKELADYKQYKAKNDTVSKIEKTFLWSNATPVYAFERFGKTAVKVFSGVQNGWDTFAYHVNDIKEYAENSFTGKECGDWEKEVHTFDLNSGKVKMTTAQLMSLYCLMKREHAKEHIKAGGIRVNDFTGDKGKVTQPRAYTISSNEIAIMLNELTPRQIDVADKLQKFMNNECKVWGNEVTMTRYGFEAFDEENYFPIKVNQNNVGNGDPNDRENSLFRLLNLSFTNPLVRGANGSIELDSIFDVFATHSTDMAKYNALALPVLDAFKWFSYKARESVQGDDENVKVIERSMRESLEIAFGKDANQYIVRFLQDLNGSKNVSREILGSGLLSSAKMASVGLNARVVALQPTSYVRALAVLDADDLSVAFTKKNNYKKAEKYCGIAMWKSLGFYDVNVGRGLSEMIKRNQTTFQKAQEASMALAGKADEITIGYLWNACEHNVLKHDKGLSGEALNNATALKLRDVIYHTQVVDSTMTRSELMRSADKKDKITTAFMSEPTLSYNMLENALHQYFIEAGKNGSAEAFKKNGKNIARTMVAYTATNLVASVVEACFDALRSKKEYLDEEDLMEMLWSNFVEDMSIIGKIPVLKDIKSIFGGYSPNSIEFQGVEAVYSIWKEIDKAINGKKMSPYKIASSMLKAFSNFSGLALSNGERDIKAIFNRTGLMTYEEMEDIFNEIIGSVFPFLNI